MVILDLFGLQVRGKVSRSISRLDKSGRVITAIDRNFARSLRRFNFWQRVRIGMYDVVRTAGRRRRLDWIEN